MGSWCPADQHFTISRIRKIFQVSSLKYNQSYLYTVSIGTNESYSDPYTCFCAWLNTFIQSLSCFFGTLSRTGKKKGNFKWPLEEQWCLRSCLTQIQCRWSFTIPPLHPLQPQSVVQTSIQVQASHSFGRHYALFHILPMTLKTIDLNHVNHSGCN